MVGFIGTKSNSNTAASNVALCPIRLVKSVSPGYPLSVVIWLEQFGPITLRQTQYSK